MVVSSGLSDSYYYTAYGRINPYTLNVEKRSIFVDNSVIRDNNNLQIAMRPAVELSYIPAKQKKALRALHKGHLADEMLATEDRLAPLLTTQIS